MKDTCAQGWPRSFFFVISLLIVPGAFSEEKIEDVIPITMANLKDQQRIYNEGWYIIPSTKRSLEYCREMTITTYRQAVQQFFLAQKIDMKKTWKSYHDNNEHAATVNRLLSERGEEGRKRIWQFSQKSSKALWHYSLDSFVKSWDALLLGTVHVGTLNERDFEELKTIPGHYFSDLSSDFKNMKDILKKIKGEKAKTVEFHWSEAFDQASREWIREYHKSGEARNSLTALPYLVWGHIKAIYYGIFKPSAMQISETASDSTRLIGKGVGKILLVPAGAILVSGRTIYSLGGVLYYSGKMGVNILSEVTSSALLSSMAILSAASVVPNYVVQGTLGVANQVALSSTGKVGAVATWTLANTATGAVYAGNLLFDLGKNTAQAVVGTSLSAIVLGYNAITALPLQLGLSAVNTVFFLVWDGPKLAVYAITDHDEAHELPVGAVVDLEKIRKKGIKIEKVSEDPKVIKKVIEVLPEDLKLNPKK
ncbi:MAG: hypothetical protein HYV97_04115 [Bdellovibrio sp.]|nr:hypothetical protein [Bdellovibrio sp.]